MKKELNLPHLYITSLAKLKWITTGMRLIKKKYPHGSFSHGKNGTNKLKVVLTPSR